MNVPAAAQTFVRRGRLIQAAVVMVLVALVCGLLAANYSTRRSLQQSKLASLQTDFDDHAMVLAHLFSERRNDLREIAASRQVHAYFENRALGMTMAYGLRASLNNITKYLQHRWNSSILLVEQIYSSLALFDEAGRPLTGWPISQEDNEGLEVPRGKMAEGDVRETSSSEGEHVFTCPVLVNNVVVGYIQGRITYATLYRHFLTNIPGTLLIGDRRQVVYRSRDTWPINGEKLTALSGAAASPLTVSWRDIAATPGDVSASPQVTLLSCAIGDRPLRLHALLHSDDLALPRENWLFFGALALFSLTVLLVVSRLIRTNISNLVLANSLDEAEKREQAVAEKKGELEKEIVQRRTAEEELARQQALLRSVIDSIPDLIVYKDRQGTYLGCNRAFEEFIGRQEADIIGKTDFDFFQPGAASSCQGHDRRALAEGTCRQPEDAMRAADGRTVLFDTLKTIYHGPDGEALGLLGISRDISIRKRQENELLQAKAYAESVIRNFLDTLLVVNRTLRIETINQATCRLLGYREEELLGQDVAMLFDEPPERIREVFRFFHDAERLDGLAQRELRNIELTYRTRGGDPCPMSFNISLLSDNGGRITGVIAGAKDVSALKRSEAQRSLQAMVIEQTHAAVLITDANGIIRYVNPALEESSGYSRTELLGARPTVFKQLIGRPAQFTDIWHTMRSGQTWRGQFSNRRRDGRQLELNATISPVRDSEGKITNFVAIMHDVSREAVLQQQLLQAQKLEAIGQLAAGIAHEINTPIQYVQNNVTFFQQAILDMSRLLHDYDRLLLEAAATMPQSPLPGAIRELRREIDLEFLLTEIPAGISEALEGIGRVVKIVSAMKEFSHPGSDRKVPSDLNKAIESTVTVARNEWKYVAELVTDLDPELPMVPCLPDRWNQAMLNLVINAAHAIAATGASKERGLGRITISTSRVDSRWVEVRVADTGCGIPEKIRNKIFEPFFTTKEVGKGTGQGLTIVHDVVVDKHGGTIRFETEPGKGTTFIIRLPLDETGQAGPAPDPVAE